ncbi:MAG: multidrug efflux RND transporter permease subunit [Rhodanobacteraceae bacterium]
MPSFFIDRPNFAWVLAILIALGGLLSMQSMGVESYPSIAPPSIVVHATYAGASAATTEQSVTEVIEQQLTGIDNLLYFTSSSSSSGSASITLTFSPGTDPDIAEVQVQNKVSLATPLLPAEVTQQGVVVAKANSGFLMVVGLRSSNPAYGPNQLNDIVASQVLNPISRIPGVGSTQQFGAESGMRIWLNPVKLHGYDISATQVLAAVEAQNVQVAAGSVGADQAVKGQILTFSVATAGLFSTPQQFANIVLRAESDGTVVTLGDVARIVTGPESYGFNSTYDGDPIGAFAIQLLPGANALTVADAVRAKMASLAVGFPQGVSWFVPYDTTTFVTTSIKEVVETLAGAIVLVFLVILLFLQNLRATLIPVLVIPVALLGAFIGIRILGFSINQLTLFGMVLAIGLVVDDAIVVIENVARIMDEEGLSPKEATRKGMGQITGAVIGMSLVLIAVFVPSAFQSGAAGIIYKQFALTIAMAIAFSAFLALSFTPALCASMLKREPPKERKKPLFFFRWFNTGFGKVAGTYVGHIGGAVRHAPRWMVVFVVLALLAGFLYTRLPGSFLPEEDQGFALATVQLPPAATIQRTNAIMARLRNVLDQNPAVDGVMEISGFSFVGQGENVGMAFIKLKPWGARGWSPSQKAAQTKYAERVKAGKAKPVNPSVTAAEFIAAANRAVRKIHGAQIFVVNLPTVSGLGQFGGFDMYLESRAGASEAELTEAVHTLVAKANHDPVLSSVRANTLPDAPQLNLTTDRKQAESMGLSISDIDNAIQLMLAPVFVNNYFADGRVRRVIMQADAPYRMSPQALQDFFTPSTQLKSDGLPEMIPIANVVKTQWQVLPPALTRYNGNSAVEIVGSPASGYASGQAMNEMEKLVTNDLPHGFGLDWTGESFQQIVAGNSAMMLMILSVVVVFLALVALYESWSIPVSVLLVVPLGILGAVVLTMLRGLPNDVYFKIGIVTVMGLAAKNAILIVEYAVTEQKAGRNLRQAVVDAARLRFRPILMTSLAFILGVLPLFFSSGAGANARHAIGTVVIGGMLFATFLGVLLVPVFYVIIRRLLGDKLDGNNTPDDNHASIPPPT